MATKLEGKIYSNETDKRYLPRWATHLRALCQISDSRKTQTVYIKNLSCGGACLTVQEDIRPNQRVDLTISFLSGACVNVSGLVRWADCQENQKMIGIRFLNLGGSVQDIILQNMLREKRGNTRDFWFRGWNQSC